VAKASAGRPAALGAKRSTRSLVKGSAGAPRAGQRNTKAGEAVVSKARFEAVMQAARQSGLLSEKNGRIGGRVSPALIKQAKRQTGIQTDTDLIEFALASVALEDRFAEAFKQARGKVDRELKLGF
jgi:hypothetical protein